MRQLIAKNKMQIFNHVNSLDLCSLAKICEREMNRLKAYFDQRQRYTGNHGNADTGLKIFYLN